MKYILLALLALSALLFAFKQDLTPRVVLGMLQDTPGFTKDQCHWYFGDLDRIEKRCATGGWFDCNSAFVNCCRNWNLKCEE
mmetsp:Transcript_4493/g.5164  ORF Transcript_4493/g.5164 Transcript_4493/m.5164 type:complete len:82 (-) Transcript_4493:106-351(-)